MSKDESGSEADDREILFARRVHVFRPHGREPVTFMTTRLPGEEPTREERVRAGLRRLAYEGRPTLHG
jgi:hypothetical protein